MKKLSHLGFLFILIFTFTFCSDEASIDPTEADASRKRLKPTANAGDDVIIKLPTNSTTLDGSLSKDSDGFIKKYQWTKISGPTSFSFSDANQNITLVNNLIEGTYTFRLTVTDDKNLSSSDDVIVTSVLDGTASIPTISNFSPTGGAVGTRVILTGTNFGTSPSILFNGKQAAIVTSSANSITTTVPLGATSGTISVTTSGVTVISAGTFSVLTTTQNTNSALYFIGNMDNVSITGTNSLTFNGWSDFTNNAYIDGLWLNNLGRPAYAFQDVRKDPVNSTQNVLYAQTIDDDPNDAGTSRAQLTFGFKNGVDLPVYHTSHRMYLNPDIAYLSNYSSAITWFTLFEIWNQHVSGWDGDGAGSARWSLSAKKASGTSQQLYWEISAQYMQPANIAYNDFWRYTNKTIPIPLGKWFTLDMYMRRGDGSNGKMVITITPDGGASTVLFNISNSTIYPGRPDIQVDSWQPFKLYLDDAYLDWMRSNGKTISAYYNDFKWYQN